MFIIAMVISCILWEMYIHIQTITELDSNASRYLFIVTLCILLIRGRNLPGYYFKRFLMNIFTKEEDVEDFIINIKPMILDIISRGFRICFLTFTDKKDFELNKKIVDKLGLKESEYCILDYTNDLNHILKQIQKSEFVVGMRFHSIVFACNMYKPLISISYSSKNEELLNDFGLDEYSIRCCYSLKKYFCKEIPLDGKELFKIYNKLINKKEEITNVIKSVLNNEKKLAEKNIEILKEFI